ETGIRVTIIDLEGNVLVDSIKDPTKMDNHIYRKEVRKSLNNLYGFSIRHSDSIGIEYIYLARKMKINDEELILRLAVSLEKTNKEVFYFWLKILGFATTVIIITLLVTLMINKKIISELEKILTQAQDISNKKTPKKIKQFLIKEFEKISNTLIEAGEKLKDIDKERSKYTGKIKLRNRQQKEMLSALSHEFKNPIAIIKGYCETIMEDDVSLKIREKFLQKILTNTNKLNGMIDRFSLALKLETDDFALKPSRFNFKECVEDIAESLQTKYKDREILVDVEDLEIEADKTLIEIVITNLIDNGLKYSQDSVSINLKKGIFTVKDNGIGIEKEEIDKITKKFYRIEKLNWNNSMGLGLFIVYYILKLHKVKLEISSKKDKGSKFSFDLSKLKK
ncbi:MAG: HAMP domain-containing histidine kinase, partial [Campylobacterales bacterium]|nr:HAMP domain-containing histidine kinase [Campylobacterales bacterium]